MRKNPLVIAVVAVLLSGICAPRAHAQEDRAAILATVQLFFDALAESDTVAGRNAVLLDGQYFRLREGDAGFDLSRVTHREFLRSLPEGDDALLERMWEPTVLQHGRMAVVWTPYDFHINGVFSHCGVDVFNLKRTENGWRIAGIMYTVELADCAPSPLGPPGAD